MDKLSIVIFAFFCINQIVSDNNYECDDPIFCQGRILHLVQTMNIYPYSKSFVDIKMLNTPDVILQNFDIFMFKHSQKPNVNNLRKFLKENFGDGDELQSWIPFDYNDNPSWIRKINNSLVKKFAVDLVRVIPKLTRKVRVNVLAHPIHYSFIAVPNGFIIPGGVNSESYYLDSYWMIKGMLLHGMTTTVKGILNNFILMEKKYGYVPKGTRIYYLNGLQPPVLALLTDLYMEHTNDIYWLRDNIRVLDHELKQWIRYRTIQVPRDGNIYTLARYINYNKFPRPEKYYTDHKSCSKFNTTEKIEQCYSNIKAAGGTGWYYPERFIFSESGDRNAPLSQSNPRRVLPVDLNVYMCKGFQVMSRFYEKLNDQENSTYYRRQYVHWLESIQKILYSPSDGIWFDYDIGLHKHRDYCYPTNFAPLWGDIFERDITLKMKLGKKALGYFKKMNLMPSRSNSLPNCTECQCQGIMTMFMPFKHMIIMALYNSGDPEAQNYAREFIRRWLEQSVDAECGKYDPFDDVELRSKEFRWGCGWIVLTSIDLINTFFVKENLIKFMV